MNKILRFIKKKYTWAGTLAIILTLSTAFTLLDAFVIPKSYAIVAQEQSGNSTDAAQYDSSEESCAQGTSETTSSSVSQTAEAETKAASTDYSYKDKNISIRVEKLNENGAIFYVADVQLSSVKYLKTAFANNTFGKNITQTTSEMAQAHDAIFAINGDYYGFRDTGLIIRNGVLYRDVARSSSDNQALTINSKGELEIVTEGEVSGSTLVKNGILQSFSFGPALVQDGKVVSSSASVSQGTGFHSRGGNFNTQGAQPRTAIGQITPLHYIFIVVDGRSNESNGMTLEQLAQEFAERGAAVAYNLDGGGSSTMYLNGKVINNPTDGHNSGERSLSDIIYIGK